MKFYGRAKEVTEQLIEAFKEGQIAEPLATIYLTRNDASPMANWSYFNQLSVLLSGCTDARGYRQWQQIGRHVRRGQKARAFILIPLIAKDKEDEEHRFLYGFKTQPVFDVTQTEGEPLPPHPHRDFLDTLPLVEVSRTWGIRVDTYSGEGHRYRGLWRKSGTEEGIHLGVANLDTWLHELMHAADHKLGNLKERGQHWRSETVAQLGACVLAHLIGRADDADEGKTWNYISGYAKETGITAITACTRVVERTAAAINLILSTAEALQPDLIEAEQAALEADYEATLAGFLAGTGRM